ncbi:nucleotidyltransferase domain-containing protein [Pseudonocardia sp. KRD-184]|uniref:Nucleotidyltransferase domain-containing protein n=1 Tax=Pseudonocardia oceani TaxID=2792013 RepID=A0ABS6U5S7_9PSEU|nr:nucleotidyltransferase domain-containing protein [Pseudonocardia oceani]MBW0091870.1 nucleotidyltransferase domain-containing protein [Pseudonocardia oceani]MBW0098974.1 nucleotidyltransferase domain-containing protein [Pseudonocardia oceani]MBW0111537.1 nucleotidyltransferase domain-containing protein [Pseudonocardia oceani]MBW0122819.1 nucleotidyltransferase domain-containing protein [Pseudonocardia oceani]MBW0127575.1 nucleotidyltransferase domain-containing protein [Pseudonocardia ocean
MTPEAISALLARRPGVLLAVLHGSRARGDGGPASDWDIGVVTDGGVDLAALTADLASALGTDAVDVVDLGRASALLRYRAARDGMALLERAPDAFLEFRIEATRFWCDAGPVIRAAQERVLADLG